MLETLMRYIRIFSDLSSQIRYSTQKRVLVEIALIKLCRPAMETNLVLFWIVFVFWNSAWTSGLFSMYLSSREPLAAPEVQEPDRWQCRSHGSST